MGQAARGLAILGTGLAALAFGLLAATEFRFTGDTEHYVGLARAIAVGDGLALQMWRQSQFPPGFPLVLAPAAWLFNGSFAAISRWAAALASLVFALTWLYLRRRGSPLALPIAILTTCSTRFLDLATDNPMAEPVYMALSLAVLIWADCGSLAGDPRRGWGWVVTGCLLLVALPAVRSIGVSAVAAAALAPLLRALAPGAGRRPVAIRDAIPVIFAAVCLGSWSALVHQSGAGYLHDLLMSDPRHPDLGQASPAQVVARIAGNAGAEVGFLDDLLMPWFWINPTWWTPALVAIGVLLVGWWRDLSSARPFAALYAFAYVGVLLVWPYLEEGPRFLAPLLPLLWMYLFEGLRTLLEALRAGRLWLRLAGLAWAVLALVGLACVWRWQPGAFNRQEIAAAMAWAALLAGFGGFWQLLVGMARRLTRQSAALLVGVGVAAFAIGSVAHAGPRIVARARGELPLGGVQRALRDASRWIANATPPDALVLTTYASRVGFATGRPTLNLPVTLSADRFLELDRRYHARFLLIVESPADTYYTPNDVEKFAVLRTLFSTRLDLVHHFDGGRIYAIRPEG